jgi:hypothetical protein
MPSIKAFARFTTFTTSMTILGKYAILLILLFSCGAIVCAQPAAGIGAVLKLDTLKDGHTLPLIQSVVPGSPAAQTLKAGQYIFSVDETTCKDLPLEQVVMHIRGEAGTKVKLYVDTDARAKHAQVYELVRAPIQQTQMPTDPVEAFNASGELEVKRLRREGHTIINTYTSDCGSYFFNFNAEKATYTVRLLTLEGKNTETNSLRAKVQDGDNETTALTLSSLTSAAQTNYSVQEGKISFSHETVGTIALQLAKGKESDCKAIFIVVYQ